MPAPAMRILGWLSMYGMLSLRSRRGNWRRKGLRICPISTMYGVDLARLLRIYQDVRRPEVTADLEAGG
jgi:hypothetical protein